MIHKIGDVIPFRDQCQAVTEAKGNKPCEGTIGVVRRGEWKHTPVADVVCSRCGTVRSTVHIEPEG